MSRFLPIPKLHQPLRYAVFSRLLRRVDHGISNPCKWIGGHSRFHDICLWRNEHQRTLASRYATAMGPMRWQR